MIQESRRIAKITNYLNSEIILDYKKKLNLLVFSVISYQEIVFFKVKMYSDAEPMQN